MKITCDARALLGALDLCAQVAPAKTTQPALQQALLHAATDGTLTVTATDLTVQVRVTTPATVIAPGSVLIPIRLCAGWLDEVDDLGAPVELELREDLERLHWRCGVYRMRTTLWGSLELPLMHSAEQVDTLPRVSAAAFRSVLPALLTVAHERDDRVHVNVEYSIVSLYAFGRDQAVLAPLLVQESATEGDWCIPARALPLLNTAEDDVQIAVDNRLMLLRTPTIEVAAVLDRNVPAVPNITQLVEERCPEDDFTVGRRELARLLGAGMLLKTPARLSYQSDGAQLVVRGARDDQDDNYAAVNVVTGAAHASSVVVDCQALQRVAREIPGDPVGINISGEVLGGPGVHLWPYQNLPDRALLVYGLRGVLCNE